MNKENKIQEDLVNYDIIVEGTIKYKISGVEDSPTPDEEQIQDGEEKIFKQLEDLANDQDYLDDTFEQDGVTKGHTIMEFSDKDVNDDKLYFKVSVSTKDSTKEIKAQDIADSLAQILKDLDANTEIELVDGWSNDYEDIEPTYVKLKIVGNPETKILKNDLVESKNDTDKYKLVLYTKMGNDYEPDVFVKNSVFNNGIAVADNYENAQSYSQQEADKIINTFEQIPENKKTWEIRIIPEDEAQQFEKDNMKESKLIDTVDRKLVMGGKLNFIKENNTKSIILNDDGIMELYENNKLINSKPFSKLGVQRECKSIFQEGYSAYIKLQEDTKSNEITDSNGDNVDLDQTKQNIKQSIEKVDELQDLKNQLQDKVDNLVNESKIEEKKINKFVSTPFTKNLLNSIEIYDLKPEEELTVEQVAYITKLFGSLEEFKESLIQLTELAAFPPQVHFISIDEYIQEMEKEFNKEMI